MKNYIPMTDIEAGQLAWIHSNKFTIPRLFWKKFVPQVTYPHACRILKAYSSPQKEFLHVYRPHPFLPAYYFLTAGAIRTLDGMDKILVRSTRYPVKINAFEREHDHMVQEIRIAFEGSTSLKDMVWVSDYEMRCGITPHIKAEYLNGTLDKGKWRINWQDDRYHARRRPDAYFEADLKGKRWGFALEVESGTSPRWRVDRMVRYLDQDFGGVQKLIVASNVKNARRMIRLLQRRVRRYGQENWFVSDFERVITGSFTDIWYQLDHPLKAA